MRNVYTVTLAKPVKIDSTNPHFNGKETNHLYVVATSYEKALEATRRKHPDAQVRGINQLNYEGVPIIAGE